MATLGIGEIFELVEKAQTRGEKIAILRQHISPTMRDVLIGAYDERVEWLLPEGTPPYRPGPSSGAEDMLYGQARTFYLYTRDGGAPPGFTQGQRERSFIQLLESLDPRDAKVVIGMKDKNLPYGVTADLATEAFPNWIFRRGRPAAPAPTPLVSSEAPILQAPVKRGRGRPKGSKNKPKKKAPKITVEYTGSNTALPMANVSSISEVNILGVGGPVGLKDIGQNETTEESASVEVPKEV